MSNYKILKASIITGVVLISLIGSKEILALFANSLQGSSCQNREGVPGQIGTCRDGDSIAGIYNENLGFFINQEVIELKKFTGTEEKTVATTPPNEGFWSAQVLPAGASSLEFTTILPEHCRSRTYQTSLENKTAILNLNYQNCQVSDYQISVYLKATIAEQQTDINWEAKSEINQGKGSLFSLSYPRLVIAPSNLGGNAQNTQIVVPFKEGKLAKWNRGNFVAPYPSSRTAFQFLAAYNQETGSGVYLSTEDAGGNSKVFLSQSPRGRDSDKPRLFAISHYPSGCANPAQKSFNFPYKTQLKLFTGNWITASKIYRDWLINSQKNLTPVGTSNRFPLFLKGAALVNHIPVGYRDVEDKTIIDEFTEWQKLVGQTNTDGSIISTWYGWQKYPTLRPNQKAHAAVKSGQKDLQGRPNLPGILSQLSGQNVHLLGYSAPHLADPRNYDTPNGFFDLSTLANKGLNGEERKRYPQGATEEGNNEYVLMNLDNNLWQTQANIMVSLANQGGFAGVYSDTLGMPLTVDKQDFSNLSRTCGNYQVSNQKAIANQINSIIGNNKVLMGESVADILLGEIPFRIVGDGLYEDFIPVTRAVFGDYTLGVLRVRESEEYSRTENRFVEKFYDNLARMYVNGYILGKFDLNDITPIQQNPSVNLYLKKLLKFSTYAKDYLRYGEYIDRLEIKYPRLDNSVIKNYQNNSLAYSFVNADSNNIDSVTLEIKEGLHFKDNQNVCLFELVLDTKTWNIQEKGTGVCGKKGENVKYNFNLAARDVRVFIAEEKR
jgi:hypothetical protein